MLWLAAVVVIVVAVIVALRIRRHRDAREFEQSSVDAEMLRRLLDGGVTLVDVRQPLDLLAYSEMIPGAKRIPPKELLADPSLLPRDAEVVLYCTCEAEKTSLEILRYARKLGFTRLKVLRGGLAGWKAKGYPVDQYRESFRLDTVV